jgi:hypothetical protein
MGDMNSTVKFILGLLLSLIATMAWCFDGKVVGVHDGATLSQCLRTAIPRSRFA